jgi:hypothetical protein
MGFFVPLAVVMACCARIWVSPPPHGQAFGQPGPLLPASG